LDGGKRCGYEWHTSGLGSCYLVRASCIDMRETHLRVPGSRPELHCILDLDIALTYTGAVRFLLAECSRLVLLSYGMECARIRKPVVSGISARHGRGLVLLPYRFPAWPGSGTWICLDESLGLLSS